MGDLLFLIGFKKTIKVNIDHPVTVACKVMEETPHTRLVGKGAKIFSFKMEKK